MCSVGAGESPESDSPKVLGEQIRFDSLKVDEAQYVQRHCIAISRSEQVIKLLNVERQGVCVCVFLCFDTAHCSGLGGVSTTSSV